MKKLFIMAIAVAVSFGAVTAVQAQDAPVKHPRAHRMMHKMRKHHRMVKKAAATK